MVVSSRKGHKKNILEKIWKRLPIPKKFVFTKEIMLFGFFGLLFFIIFLRLFFLQVIYADYYDWILQAQQVSKSELKANRGDVYITDKAGKTMKLTENVDFYTIFVEPKHVFDKTKLLELITPLVYEHLCVVHTTEKPTKEECIRNTQEFIQQPLLPNPPSVFYLGSGLINGDFTYHLSWYYNTGAKKVLYDFSPYYERITKAMSWYTTNLRQTVDWFTTGKAFELIRQKLDWLIIKGYRDQNYLGFFENQGFLEALKGANLPFITIQKQYYVYIDPKKVVSVGKSVQQLEKILRWFGYENQYNNITKLFYQQEIGYVEIIKEANPQIAKEIKLLKYKYANTLTWGVPLLHGLGIDQSSKRYYPFGTFLSNILGYVDPSGQGHYGIEEFFQQQLRGKDGSIIGRSSPRVWQVGANDFEVIDVIHWSDLYLTIDPTIQKNVEELIKWYFWQFKADSISALIMDPFNGRIIASANYPTFDPNHISEIYNLKPLSPKEQQLVEDDTYTDIPIFYLSGGVPKVATYSDRKNTTIQKYISKNTMGPLAFVDKNISFPYEPGSIFKAFTLGWWLDSDEITLYDFYTDDGQLTIGPYTIKNVDRHCLGTNTFLHAFMYSCNVWMVRIAQKLTKQTFYNYIDRLGFWKMTNVELAGEDPGFVEDINTVSVARFFNNAFWQGLLATPIQIASAYSTLVNGGYLIKPTIIDRIYNKKTNQMIVNEPKKGDQIYKKETSDLIRESLFKTISNPVIYKFSSVKGYTVGWKSGTSQISFKGKYQNGVWWTNGSFIGIVTKDNLKYLVIIQVRRPRRNIRWEATAGKLFGEISKFLINYELIDK